MGPVIWYQPPLLVVYDVLTRLREFHPSLVYNLDWFVYFRPWWGYTLVRLVFSRNKVNVFFSPEDEVPLSFPTQSTLVKDRLHSLQDYKGTSRILSHLLYLKATMCNISLCCIDSKYIFYITDVPIFSNLVYNPWPSPEKYKGPTTEEVITSKLLTCTHTRTLKGHFVNYI